MRHLVAAALLLAPALAAAQDQAAPQLQEDPRAAKFRDVERGAFVGWRDRNDWERLFVYAHGRASWARTYPEGLFGTRDVLAAGGIGLDYYTKQRHFSLGAALDGVYATKAKTFGIAIYPTLRWTF